VCGYRAPTLPLPLLRYYLSIYFHLGYLLSGYTCHGLTGHFMSYYEDPISQGRARQVTYGEVNLGMGALSDYLRSKYLTKELL